MCVMLSSDINGMGFSPWICDRWEKAIGTHTKPYWIRLPSRLPVALVIWFIGALRPDGIP